jgi:pimeloyl-ACP methyl ester carboxylesterase
MAAGEMRWLSELLQMRFVAIEYPGYGNRPGEPTEKSIYAAAEEQLRELQGERVVLVGQSLGTGPAVEMARRGFGTRLVLMTPFTSIPDVAKTTMPYLPIRLLTKDKFDNAAKASAISMPVLVVHGERDEVVPFRLGEKLASLFSHAQLMTVPEGRHNDLWERSEVLKRVRDFAMQ